MSFINKMLFPPLWSGGFGAGALAMWLSVGPPLSTKYGFVTAWFVGTIVIWWICAPLKRVRIDGRNLYISNYLKEITVPLALVDDVTEVRWINIHPVIIRFRGDTEFGNKVTFMPKARFAMAWSSHPVVGEIKRLAQAAAAGNAS